MGEKQGAGPEITDSSSTAEVTCSQESQLQPPVLSLCEMWMEAHAGGLQLMYQHCGVGGRHSQGPVRL